MELKRIRQTQGDGTVKTALAQVRTLSLRQSTSNAILLASVENLYDVAEAIGHEDKDLYKLTLKACRENENGGPLQGLIIKLLGDDTAKRTQAAIDTWKKDSKKRGKGERESAYSGS